MSPLLRKATALLQALLLSLSLFLPAYAVEEGEGVLSHAIEGALDLFRGTHDSLPTLPITDNPQIEQLIDIAAAEHGYTFREDGTTKYGDWYNYPTAQWCGIFVAWCAEQAGIPTSIIAKMGTTDASWYATNGTLHYFFDQWLDNRIQNTITAYGIRCEKDEYIPKRGDLVYFKWADSSYSATFDHVGIVAGVIGNTVYTVEGNSGYPGTVRFKSYDLTAYSIRAYATPNYPPTAPYETGFFRVRTASGLNLRQAPDVTSPILTTIPNFTVLRISDIVDNAWGLTEYDGKTGYVSLAYTGRESDIPVVGIAAPSVITVPIGYTFPSGIAALPSDATDRTLSYHIENEEVCTVDADGNLQALALGRSFLTVASPAGFEVTIEVSVVEDTESGSYSGWITLLPPPPDNAKRYVESVTMYRYRFYDSVITESATPPEGYVLRGDTYLYGDWSEPITVSDKPVESHCLEILSQNDTYVYEHYHITYSNGSKGLASYHTGVGEVHRCEITVDEELPASVDIKNAFLNTVRCDSGNKTYFLKSHTTTYTYREREATPAFEHVYETEFTPWSEEKPEPAEFMILQEQLFHRYFDDECVAISLLTPPSITDLTARTPIDPTGMTALVTYRSGKTETVSDGFTLSGYDALLEGEQTITVQYLGQSDVFTVRVTDPTPPVLTAEPLRGVWRSELSLNFEIARSYGLHQLVLYLDYDADALILGAPTTTQNGAVTLSFDTDGHTAALHFLSPDQATANGLLLSIPLTVSRQAELKSYPIAVSYAADRTLRLPDKPVRLLVSDTAVEVEAEKYHTYRSTLLQPSTCTEAGSMEYCCVTCDYTFVSSLPMKPHSYEEQIVTEPSCTLPGLKRYHCTECGHEKEEELPLIAHVFEETVEIEPTCTAEGLKATVCTSCGERTEQILPALPHSYVTERTEPTCTAEGVERSVCSLCLHVESVTLPKIDHDYHTSIEQEPSCLMGGLEATVCTACGERTEKSLPAFGHRFSDWEVTAEPSCLSGGSRHRTCSACAVTEDEELNPLGHDYIVTVTPPSSTEDGYTDHVCSRCGDSYRDGYTEALGYAVRFLDHDGTVLYSAYLTPGAVILPPSTPSRPSDPSYHYEFSLWEGYTEGMTADADLTFTATYTAKKRYYPVVFRDEDGIVYKEVWLSYGSLITPPDATPSKSDEKYNYTFVGYQGYTEGMTVQGDTTITVLFERSTRLPQTITSDRYEINTALGRIVGIAVGTSVGDLIAATGQSEYLSVLSGGKELASTALVGSGMTLRLSGGGEVIEDLIIVVNGDLSGDGKLTLTDFVRLKTHLLGKTPLEGALADAADLSGDHKITLTDYVRMKQALLSR